MRNLLQVPSPRTADFLVEAADWVEVSTFFKADQSISREDLALSVARAHSIRDERARVFAGDVFVELADRIVACGDSSHQINRYPFQLNKSQTNLTLRGNRSVTSHFGVLYIFMLLITRSGMDADDRSVGNIDPTKVFERLCAQALGNFWGGMPGYSGSLVFGTARTKITGAGRFSSNIDHLCQLLGEGISWRKDAIPPDPGDGGLDVVAWRRFSDSRRGSLIGFGQCKTGIHWKHHVGQLKPEAFVTKYMQDPPVISPIRLYMVPSRIHGQQWREHSLDAGLLLDRCRITQYAHPIDVTIANHCRKWIKAAIAKQRKGKVQK